MFISISSSVDFLPRPALPTGEVKFQYAADYLIPCSLYRESKRFL